MGPAEQVGWVHFLTVLSFPDLEQQLIYPTRRDGAPDMGEDLDDLRRRMMGRRQRYRARNRLANSLALAVTTVGAGFVSVLLWQQMSPPDFRADHPAAYVSVD